MSDTTSAPLTLSVHNYQPGVETLTQYGVRFPDGTITWARIETNRNRDIIIADLVPHPGEIVGAYSRMDWDELLKHRAERAKLDLAEYTNGHDFVKRTLVIAITAFEDVS